jgi:predicted Zn-dependent peptidase
MSTHVSTLANGMRIVSHDMPHVETASLGVWVKVGARHESARDNGISHFLEHMAFKGTERRSALAIAEEIEQVGGDLNAATSLETTAYFARVLKADVGLALELIADILLNPRYEATDLEREREVILQEIASTQDSPDEIAYELLNAVAYPDQAIGRPVLGTPDTVAAFGASDLRGFLKRHYRPHQMVLSAAGAVDHAALVRQAEPLFGHLEGGPTSIADVARYVGGPKTSDKPFEQAHLLLGFQGSSYRTPDFYTGQVFSGLFGGGMSSRLFQEVREKHGLCYSIYSTCWSFDDTGMLAIHAATGRDMMGKLIDVVQGELHRSAASAPDLREVERSKAQLKAGLLMSLESSGARAEQMARQLMFFDRLVGASELVERVEAVTPEAVRVFAERMLAAAPASIAIVGAGRKSELFAQQAGATARAA